MLDFKTRLHSIEKRHTYAKIKKIKKSMFKKQLKLKKHYLYNLSKNI